MSVFNDNVQLNEKKLASRIHVYLIFFSEPSFQKISNNQRSNFVSNLNFFTRRNAKSFPTFRYFHS